MEVGSLEEAPHRLKWSPHRYPNGAEIRPAKSIRRRVWHTILDHGYNSQEDIYYRLWNVVCTLILIACALPVLIIVSLLLICSSGFPVFYRGQRLGKDRQPFNIYKFRTLKVEAEALTRAQVLPDNSMMETRFGALLRDSRMDEIPQLFNILKGDMNLFGPRPVRPEIANMNALQVPNYDLRFTVKPGLIGHTQMFLPHGAPKRMRAYYNAILIKRPVCIWKEMVTIVLVTAVMFGKIFSHAKRRLVRNRTTKRQGDTFETHGSHVKNALVYVAGKNGTPKVCGQLLDIDSKSFTIRTNERFNNGEDVFVLRIQTPVLGKSKQAFCTGVVVTTPTNNCGSENGHGSHCNGHQVQINYIPKSPLNAHMIAKYFMQKSFISS